MEDRPVRFQHVAAAGRTVKLTPGAAAGMAVGAEIAQPRPPLIVTACMGAEMPRGVNHTGTPVRRWHGLGASWRRRRGVVGGVCTRRTGRTLGEALEGCGCLGPLARELEGRGFGRWRR